MKIPKLKKPSFLPSMTTVFGVLTLVLIIIVVILTITGGWGSATPDTIESASSAEEADNQEGEELTPTGEQSTDGQTTDNQNQGSQTNNGQNAAGKTESGTSNKPISIDDKGQEVTSGAKASEGPSTDSAVKTSAAKVPDVVAPSDQIGTAKIHQN